MKQVDILYSFKTKLSDLKVYNAVYVEPFWILIC